MRLRACGKRYPGWVDRHRLGLGTGRLLCRFRSRRLGGRLGGEGLRLDGRRRGRRSRRGFGLGRGGGRRRRLRGGRSRRWRDRGRRDRLGRGRARGAARREKAQRIEVAVPIGADAHAKEDIRLGVRRDPGRADGPDDGALGDLGVPADGDRAEVDERDGVPVRGRDRDAQAARRDGAGERDRSAPRREDRRGDCAADVDSSVLPTGVRVVPEVEPGEYRSRRGPCPGPSGGCEHQEQERHGGDSSRERQHASTVGRGSRRCQSWLQSCHTFVRVLLQRSPVELVPARAGQP
jgi:ATP-dependent RNA helicase RhlE